MSPTDGIVEATFILTIALLLGVVTFFGFKSENDEWFNRHGYWLLISALLCFVCGCVGCGQFLRAVIH